MATRPKVAQYSSAPNKRIYGAYVCCIMRSATDPSRSFSQTLFERLHFESRTMGACGSNYFYRSCGFGCECRVSSEMSFDYSHRNCTVRTYFIIFVISTVSSINLTGVLMCCLYPCFNRCKVTMRLQCYHLTS